MAEAVGKPVLIKPEHAANTRETVGSHLAGWFSFQPIYDVLLAEQPEMLE